MDEKERVICSKCGEQITKVIYSKKANHYYHHRGKKTPCSLKTSVITPDMEVIETKNQRDTKLADTKNQRSKNQTKENEIDTEEESGLPISDEIKKKEGIYDMEILPSAKKSHEILEEILRTYGASEKITRLLVRKCARRSLTPDEVLYNLTLLGVRKNEADWIADEYNDAIADERMRRMQEETKPRHHVVRESVREPFRSRGQHEAADPAGVINRNEQRAGYSASASGYVYPPDYEEYLGWKYSKRNNPPSLSEEKIREMIKNAMADKSDKDRIDGLSTSINDLKLYLKGETEKIRDEIPSDLHIRDIAGKANRSEEGSSKESVYEKTLKQKIEDLKEERDELKNDLKEKEKTLKERLDSLEKIMNANKDSQKQQLDTYNEDTWRYKSDITGTVMRGVASITKDVLNKAPVRKGLNIWVRGAEREGEETETEPVREIEPKIEPPGLPQDYISEE